MEIKGTKKGWKLNDTDNEIFGKENNYHQISAGYGYYDNNNHKSGFCIQAFISKENAQLIAHAPEMLEMLHKIALVLEMFNPPSKQVALNWSKKINQLIKQATTI